jgi:hypothetical protein
VNGDCRQSVRNQEAREHMGRAAALARFEPVLYEVVDTIGG